MGVFRGRHVRDFTDPVWEKAHSNQQSTVEFAG